MTDALPRVMVDIETLGTEPGAAIPSIGAVRFDAGRLGDTFERSISLPSCESAGLRVDFETLEWWLEQDADAQTALTGGEPLGAVLCAFSAWYADADEIWANSPSFDCALLEAAYESVGDSAPWEYYEERDYRTLTSLPGIPNPGIEHDGVAHDALDDAKHQAHVVAATLERLREVRYDD